MKDARSIALAVAASLAVLAVSPAAGGAGGGGKVAELSKALLSDPSFKVRTQAALLLGRLGDKAGIEPLARALRDENKTVRAMAAESLGRLGGDRAAAALRALLLRERDGFVRRHAEKALAAVKAVPAGGAKERKLYLKVGPFTGGSKAANAELLALLRNTLRKSLSELEHTGVLEGAEERNLRKGGKPAFIVDGNVLKLEERVAGAYLETSCEVKVVVARWPSRSVILWTSAGAAVQGGKRDRDRQNARQDCLEASAGQLAESLIGYFRSQGG